MKILFFILAVILLNSGGYAQRKIFFSSKNDIGAAIGENGPSLQMQTINGIKYKKWFAGAGIGINYYYQRTVPVFIEVSRNIFRKSKTPFLYADAGINIPTEKEKALVISHSSGVFYDLGAGFNLPLYKSNVLLFSIGYSSKAFSEKAYNESARILSTWPPPESYIETYHYVLRTISLKVAWSFSL